MSHPARPGGNVFGGILTTGSPPMLYGSSLNSSNSMGGVMEYSQTSIMEQNQSQHRHTKQYVQKQRGGAATSLGTSPLTGTTIRSEGLSSCVESDNETSPLLPGTSTKPLRATSVPSMLELYNRGFESVTDASMDTTIRFQVVVWLVTPDN